MKACALSSCFQAPSICCLKKSISKSFRFHAITKASHFSKAAISNLTFLTPKASLYAAYPQTVRWAWISKLPTFLPKRRSGWQNGISTKPKSPKPSDPPKASQDFGAKMKPKRNFSEKALQCSLKRTNKRILPQIKGKTYIFTVSKHIIYPSQCVPIANIRQFCSKSYSKATTFYSTLNKIDFF